MTLQKYLPAIMKALGGDLAPWSHQCHAASLVIVRARIFPHARVARGWCRGVGGQHSWVVVGGGTDIVPACYDIERAQIVDPTLWSYDKSVSGVWFGSYEGRHTPHGGFGDIWNWGRPENAEPGKEIVLTPREPFSKRAATFIELLGPLDRRGWAMLANQAPVLGWPSGEIFAAMLDTKGLSAEVPVDKIGMLTDRDPKMYLPEPLPDGAAAPPACGLCHGPVDGEDEFCHGCGHHICERCGDKEPSRMQTIIGSHKLSDHEPSDEEEDDRDPYVEDDEDF